MLGHLSLSVNHKLKKLNHRGVSSLGSARNLAREPHVFKSSARLGSIFGSSGKLDIIFFGSKARVPIIGMLFSGSIEGSNMMIKC